MYCLFYFEVQFNDVFMNETSLSKKNLIDNFMNTRRLWYLAFQWAICAICSPYSIYASSNWNYKTEKVPPNIISSGLERDRYPFIHRTPNAYFYCDFGITLMFKKSKWQAHFIQNYISTISIIHRLS